MSKILYPEQEDYLKNFQLKENNLLAEMRRFAEENKIPILMPEASSFLEHLICLLKPQRILEIGTAIAYSSIRMARASMGKSLIDTIELSGDNIKLAKKFIAKSNLSQKINLIEGKAQEIIPNLNYLYDFIFLDADKEDYIELFNLSVEKLKIGGTIFIDNLLWHGFAALEQAEPKYENSSEYIRKFNNLFFSDERFKSALYSVGDGIGLGIKIKD